MPLQSGSSKILRDMKRGYTKQWYLDRALKLRQSCPGVAISTDIIVGYPSESEEDFAETMEVLEAVRFEQVFSFKFSPRPLTPAASLKPLDDEISSERLSRLQSAHAKILDEIAGAQKDKIFDVYFEELREGGTACGRSFSNFLICAQGGEELLGKTHRVRVEKTARMALYGKVIA